MHDPGYIARVDGAKVRTARRTNTVILVASVAFGALLVVLLALAASTGMGWFSVLISLFGVLACAASAVLAHRRRRALDLLVARDGIALAVGPSGVRLAAAPFIPWDQIVFIGLLDDRARSARTQSARLSGALARATIRAGSPTMLCEIGVRDATALRRSFAGARGAERVTLFDEFDGLRRGLVPLMLDAVLDDATSDEAAQVLLREAERRGIPARGFDRVFSYFEWKGPMIDRKWPAQKGSPA